jgi:YHS domain-containing protein
MIGWVLRLLLFLIVVRLVWRFLAGVMDGMTAPASKSKGAGAKAVPLVRDPVCGTYIVRERALTIVAGKQTQYFCSETCRDEYARRGFGPPPLREAK